MPSPLDRHTVLAREPAFNAAFARCARALNLKGHRAGVAAATALLHGPCDLEGHLGADGRWYVLDLARLFPPEAPAAPPLALLARRLRPELVKRAATPLSSDAFTLFGRHDAARHNEEVRAATRLLLEQAVPRVAAKLDLCDAAALRAARGPAALSPWLLREAHCAGVNVRHLGRVRRCARAPALRRALATELAARVLKNDLRAQLRQCTAAEEGPYRALALAFFNEFFFPAPAAAAAWAGVAGRLQRTYAEALDEAELGRDLRELLDVHHLFLRLQELTGVRFRADLPLARLARFEAGHLEGIFARAKTMYAVPRIEADAAIELARTAAAPADVRRALATAREKYDACLELKPDDHEVLASASSPPSPLCRSPPLFFAGGLELSSCSSLSPLLFFFFLSLSL